MKGDISTQISELKDLFFNELRKFEENTKIGQTPQASSFDSFKYFILKSVEDIEKQCNEMKKKTTEMENHMEVLSCQLDDQENYTRRNCLLFHGLPEENGEDTDTKLLAFLETELKIKLNIESIERSHRMGKPSTRARPIIARFVSYRVRQKIFMSKKQLKGKKLLITESLSRAKADLWAKVRAVFKKECWTGDGRLFVKIGEQVKVINSASDLEKATRVKERIDAESDAVSSRTRKNTK